MTALANALPQSLIDNPRLDRWIAFEPGRRVRLATGKVELGQGVLTALLQIAADELDVAPEACRVICGDTAGPNEGTTSGSMSIIVSGASLRLVAADVRALALAEAAKQLDCGVDQLSIRDGVILRDGKTTDLDYWSLASSLDLTVNVTGRGRVKTKAERRLVGTDLPRIDLPTKVFAEGRPFVHDVTGPDLLHARVIRQPWPGAELSGIDNARIDAACGAGARFFRKDNFGAVLAERESDAERIAGQVAKALTWSGGKPISDAWNEHGYIRGVDATSRTLTYPNASAPRATAVATHRASYTKPNLSPAPIGPACAVARLDDRTLTVWTQSQSVFATKGIIARALGRDLDVRLVFVPGPGTYGHSACDDAAGDAALLAAAHPGRTVRVQLSRADETGHGPYGSAMAVDLEAELDADGRPVAWRTSVWSAPHGQRPGSGGANNMLPADALRDAPPPPFPADPPDAGGGGGIRNGQVCYDIAEQTLVHHFVPFPGVRTSSLRGLGAYGNSFAIEAFIDELAERAGVDPLDYRLSLVSNPRGRAVIERVAAISSWREKKALGENQGDGQGRGIAYSQYKNRGAYCAIVADVTVDTTVRVDRIWCVVDGGLIINPDGARNQVEGGIIQAVSWTLKEQAAYADGRVASTNWDSYPILRFSEVPDLHVDLIASEAPSMGMGEAATPVIPGAIANAIYAAVGLRLRDTPFTRDRLITAAAG